MSNFKKPPDFLIINNTKYHINTDFRVWIDFQKLILKNNNDIQKTADLIFFLKKLNLPFFETSLIKVLEFFQGGFTKTNSNLQKNNKLAYDFDVDEALIYTAFLTQYNIDLTISNIHWWNFKRLFAGLEESHLISKVMWARTVDLKKLDKQTKEYAVKLKEKYPLHTNNTKKYVKTAEEKYKNMLDYVNKRYAEIKN